MSGTYRENDVAGCFCCCCCLFFVVCVGGGGWGGAWVGVGWGERRAEGGLVEVL